jgi:uncharacterized protein YacL (UPF0231 family)
MMNLLKNQEIHSMGAEEIVLRQAKLLVELYYDDEMLAEDLSWYQAKRCAMIATERIIDTLYEYHYDSQSGAYEFWTKVKRAIKDL